MQNNSLTNSKLNFTSKRMPTTFHSLKYNEQHPAKSAQTQRRIKYFKQNKKFKLHKISDTC